MSLLCVACVFASILLHKKVLNDVWCGCHCCHRFRSLNELVALIQRIRFECGAAALVKLFWVPLVFLFGCCEEVFFDAAQERQLHG